MALRRTLAAWLLVGSAALALGSAPALAGPPEGPAVDPEADTKALAKAEVVAAIAAFEVGDYALALVHFEAAMALRPSPKLHYNIAVCHQRLSLQTDDPEARTRHREQAIDSYNRYLEQNPEAEDRLDVAAIVRELGGTPVINTPIKPVFEPVADPPDEGPDPDPDPVPDELPPDAVDGQLGDPPALPKPPPPPRHGRFGVLLGLGLGSSLISNRDIAARGLFMIDLHGGGFVGRERRFLLALQTSVYTGASLRTDRLSFWAFHLGLLAEQQWVVARERLAIGLGGVVGLASQTVLQGTNAAPPICTVGKNSQVAGRNGGQFGDRFDLSVLIGQRRRGMLMVMLQPTYDVFGPPKNGAGCMVGQSPWEALNVTERWQFLLFASAGYALRF
jgi:tetratricopeptide (TPR) repeat protein